MSTKTKQFCYSNYLIILTLGLLIIVFIYKLCFQPSLVKPITPSSVLVPSSELSIVSPTPVIDQELCTNQMTLGQDIADLSIEPGQKIFSPGKLSGKIKGSYCFEAVCGFYIFDGVGNTIYTANLILTDDWMTDQLVPFTVNFNFDAITTEVPHGTIVIVNDNPSGLAANAWCYEIPVILAVN